MKRPTDHSPTKVLARAISWPLLCGLLSVAVGSAALATDPVYEVNFPASYEIPPDNLPLVDATNFVVDNGYSFVVNFEATYVNPPLFESWNTLNYTNNGVMSCDTGFWFDLQKTNAIGDTQHLPAANFYNPGIIDCGSTNTTGLSSSSTVVSSSGAEFLVNATNVAMPGGSVNVGADGLMAFDGQNVDLSYSTLTMEGGGGTILGFRGNSYAGYGVDTNAEWNPGTDLTPTTAMPSEVEVGHTVSWEDPPGFPSYPATTTPYVAEYQVSTNRFVYQYVFLNNMMTNVTAIVEMGYTPASRGVRESDIAEVQFAGSAVNPATGLAYNSYILFEDDYAAGAGNPVISSTGIPNNFVFEISSAPFLAGAGVASGFLDFTNPVAFSNNYAFVDVHCLPTTVDTNTPSNQLTNYLAVLPGSIQINASGNLNLTGAQISGQNYLSVNAPLQLDKIAGAAFSSPFSDINVGQASGNVAVTNLVEPTVPEWSGTLAAWSTRWTTLWTNSTISTDTNNVSTTNSFTVTNDYNVVILANQAVPSTPSAVWNLFVHGTNSITLSDSYNLLNGLFLDCERLTLTTNGPGAQSPYGELNLQGTSVNWAAATPNLLYLTNNGVILLPLAATGLNSLGFFGSASAPYAALVNTGLIEDQGSVIWTTNFVNTGTLDNGPGRFTLQSQTATLLGGTISAGGDVSITTGGLLADGLTLEADGSLTLAASTQLADFGVTNGGIWNVGSNSVGTGIVVPLKPSGGQGYGNSLLGTTINLYAPMNRNVANVWAGADMGRSPAGFTNNLAVGRLILDAQGPTPATGFTFNGAGVSNALYVDYLELRDGATNLDNGQTGTNFVSLNFNTNLVIYYAQAVINGHSVARRINGWNSGHLRWVPQYAGYYSSTNLVYADGTTITINAALAGSSALDSDGDGIANVSDPTPFFVPSEVHFTATLTNAPALMSVLRWISIPDATNALYYATNLLSPNWLALTNIVNAPAPPFAPLTNTVYDPVNPAQPRFYKVVIWPNSADLYGPGF